MLRGPAWSGSIQQDLIEKLWVAILTCDTSDPKPKHEFFIDKEKENANESDKSEESSSSDDDSDIDLELDELAGGVALVDRYDLFSMVKRKQSQQDETECSVTRDNNPASGPSVNKTKESDNLLVVSSQNIKSINNEVAREENKSYAVACKSSEACASTNQLSGAKPKLSVTTPSKVDSQGRRPRPNSLNFSTTSQKSRIPQLSPLSPSDVSKIRKRKIPVKSHSFSSIKTHKERTNLSTVNQGKASKIPISPQKQLKVFEAQHRAHLLDIVPRRRLWSDPHQNHETKIVKSSPVIFRRKAVTPDTARPSPLQRSTANKEEREKPDTRRSSQRQFYRGTSNRWSTKKNGTDATKERSCTTNTVVKSKGDPQNSKVLREQRKMKQVNEEEKQNKSGRSLPISPMISRSTISRGNTATKNKTNPQTSLNTTTRSSGTRIKTQNKDHVLTSNSPKTQRCKPTTFNTKQKQVSTTKIVTKTEKEVANAKVGNKGQIEIEHKYNVKELEEEKEEKKEEVEEGQDDAPQELHDSGDVSETTAYGNNVEVTRLEACLKEAILGVLHGLPEGWILVPEHTAELFSSLTSVVESFPRPNHARARVLEAIVDAHARRPCGKGEIAALNNAHLLLYVGLKLCCVEAGKVETNNNQKEEEEDVNKAMMPKQTTMKHHEQCQLKAETDTPKTFTKKGKNKSEKHADTNLVNGIYDEDHAKDIRESQLSHILSLWKEKNHTMHKEDVVLKILNEIQKCEGSFDRLMMCLLLGSRAPGRGSGWYCETEEESEKVRDLRLVLDHLKYVKGYRVSEVVSDPLWSCGSSPVVLAALAESPRLVLALLQYGAGGSAANYYRYSKYYTNGVYLAIAYLVRKLESQFAESPVEDNHQNREREDVPPADDAPNPDVDAEGHDDVAEGDGNDKDNFERRFKKRNLLMQAGQNPTAICLRYLLRAVPRVPIKFLRDQMGGCNKECGREVAYLLPHSCCLQPPTLTHLSRAACRQYLRIYDLLPQIIEDLNVPHTLKDYLNLLKD